ncbi:acyltransferase [Flavobacterium sp. LC2016-12]|uniref:acyltransferase family protein n=1 Tax=Flavobacterium sp. LC2016-12 TaxID=2783794 RepID=UPI00188CB494|nr:acyltransferase [Flavobacterium sp. LC2016-12]MBF4464714.1 acyltransferase [Flavobacterium sp. LC2016-12]
MDLKSDSFKKYNWIDFGRGIAILLVIIVHVGQNFSDSIFLKKFTEVGSMGVQLFFILSSITLFNSYGNRYEKDGNERNIFFFIRRFFRIAPLYYFFALFYTLIEILLKGIHSVEYWKVLISVLFLNGVIVPVINYIPPGGWSIGTEVLFYYMIPFLFSKIKSIKDSVILLIISILFSSFINFTGEIIIDSLKITNHNNFRGYYLYHWLPNQFPVFCSGILLFNIFKTVHFPIKIKRIFLIISLFLFIFFSQTSLTSYYFYYTLQKPYIYSAIFCLFIIGIKDLEFKNRTGNFLRLIGKYSFCMYLLHFFILRVYSIAISFTGFNKKSDLFFLISYVLITAFTYFFSSKLYQYEKKGISFGDFQIQKLKEKLIKN